MRYPVTSCRFLRRMLMTSMAVQLPREISSSSMGRSPAPLPPCAASLSSCTATPSTPTERNCIPSCRSMATPRVLGWVMAASGCISLPSWYTLDHLICPILGRPGARHSGRNGGMSYVFISHVEEDQDIAYHIAVGLEEAGFKAWYYERDSIPGPSYLTQILDAIQESA